MKNRGRRYSQNFKEEAIRYVQENDVSITVAAKTLNVSTTTLHRWVQQAEVDSGNAKNGELTTEERLELRRLRREVRELKIEAEILKKAAVYFAKDQW